jgi:hypothetical protein
MKRTIVAIAANTTPVRYISTTTNTKDKSVLAELTEDKNQAHDFVNMENASRIIPSLVNPFERVYKAVTIEVNRKASAEVDEFVFN